MLSPDLYRPGEQQTMINPKLDFKWGSSESRGQDERLVLDQYFTKFY